jgi:hypothetical protein
MKPTKHIIQQIIASTNEDSHGERVSKEFLEKICRSHANKKLPLHQQHDMSKETIGYCENFNLVYDDKTEEYHLKTDIYFTCETIDEAMRGFSWSYIEGLTPNYETSEYRICLPYPFYNDQALITNFTDADPSLGIGAWRKKALDPNTIALLFSGVCFALGPMWNNIYNDHVAPNIKNLFTQYKQLEEKGLTADFVQTIIGNLDEEFGVHFVPDRSNEKESFTISTISQGLSEVHSFLKEDQKSKTIGIYRIKLFYNSSSGKYEIFHAEYLDGTDINIA